MKKIFLILITVSILYADKEAAINQWFNKHYKNYNVIEELDYKKEDNKIIALIEMKNKYNKEINIEVIIYKSDESEQSLYKKCLPTMEEKNGFIKLKFNEGYCERRFGIDEYTYFIQDLMKKISGPVSNTYTKTYNREVIDMFKYKE